MEQVIILYPCPLAGHLPSMVELAKKLILSHQSKSLSVIILITTIPPQFTSTTPYIERITNSTTPSITFHHLPTVTLPPILSSSDDPMEIFFQLTNLQNPNFHATLHTLSQTLALKAVVLDILSSPAFNVSTALNIPTYFYYASSASALAALLYFPTAHETRTTNLQDLNDYIYCPGTPPIYCLDLPDNVHVRDTNIYNGILSMTYNVRQCAGILSNTFEAFEPRAVKAIVEGLCIPNGPTPPFYGVGPLLAIDLQSNGSGQRHECLSWLDLQPSRSVVFLCFGSMGLFSEKQLKEMAIGLENSRHSFLWVVRGLARMEPEPEPNLDALLPEGFLERTKGKGLVVYSWVPQVDVLSHDAIGGFVTHCGWNSTLEAVLAGVPMLAWPLYAEQRMNRVFMVEELKVAVSIDESKKDRFVTSEKLEKGVIELMEGEDGKAVRERVREMRNAAGVEEGGSSTVALAKFLHSFKGI